MRYSASSPQLLAWLDQWNAGKSYDEQIRPFGFMLSYTARTGIFAQSHEASIVDSPTRGRPRQNCVPKPIAPYPLMSATEQFSPTGITRRVMRCGPLAGDAPM